MKKNRVLFTLLLMLISDGVCWADMSLEAAIEWSYKSQGRPLKSPVCIKGDKEWQELTQNPILSEQVKQLEITDISIGVLVINEMLPNLTRLSVHGSMGLKKIICEGKLPKLTTLCVSSNPCLLCIELSSGNLPNLKELKVTNNMGLEELIVLSETLTHLDASSNRHLKTLVIKAPELEFLNIEGDLSLRAVDLASCQDLKSIRSFITELQNSETATMLLMEQRKFDGILNQCCDMNERDWITLEELRKAFTQYPCAQYTERTVVISEGNDWSKFITYYGLWPLIKHLKLEVLSIKDFILPPLKQLETLTLKGFKRMESFEVKEKLKLESVEIINNRQLGRVWVPDGVIIKGNMEGVEITRVSE